MSSETSPVRPGCKPQTDCTLPWDGWDPGGCSAVPAFAPEPGAALGVSISAALRWSSDLGLSQAAWCAW